jgi:predicted transcriptional regulator of viral defense system
MILKDLADLAALQDGVVTRRQALAAGLSVRQVEWRLTSGRWVRAHAGVYQTQPGRRDQASAESAAVLACGTGAVLSHWSVAHHVGLARSAPKQIHVSVPSARRVVNPLGVTVYRTVRAVDASSRGSGLRGRRSTRRSSTSPRWGRRTTRSRLPRSRANEA